MILREYQQEAVDAIYDYFQAKNGNPLVVVPTGGGKSLIQAAFIRSVLGQWPDQRIMLLTHVKELLQQNGKELVTLWPEAEPLLGFYSAGLCSRRTDRQITIAGIQSVHRRAAEFGRQHLVIVDEAHLLSPNGHSMYQRFIGELREINPALKVIGLTATPYRLDSGMLNDGEGTIFTDIAYNTDLRRLIDAGYLAPLTTKLSKDRADLSAVKVRGGEYVPGDLERTMNADDVVSKALDETMRLCADRNKWLIFCAGVEHAENVANKLCERGILAECITGETPKAERDAIIEEFKRGAIRALTNVNVLTTGFNVPDIDAMIVLRPTKSPGLHVQMMGRGMRTAPGKTDCLVLDFTDNILTHGPIADIRIKAGPGEKQEVECAPQKLCPECAELMPLSARECSECGYIIPEEGKEPKHSDRAAIGASVMFSERPEPVRRQVTRVRYSRHKKHGKPDSMRVTYICFPALLEEWVCFEHGGYPRTMAERWWRTRAGDMTPPPATVTEALERRYELRIPFFVTVDESGKFPKIVGFDFSDQNIAHGPFENITEEVPF